MLLADYKIDVEKNDGMKSMREGIVLKGTYRIIKPIGAGGLGEVYLAYHENLRTYVVVKRVKDSHASLMNSRIEVDILKGLHHSYLPQVYDFLELPDGIFTVMEYISGHDLKYYMDRNYQFSLNQLCRWFRQLCEVLRYLHSRSPQILHCDIKPGNIMINEEGEVCLIDFNISLDGENNKELVGLSSYYASPEQYQKAEYKRRGMTEERIRLEPTSDIYSLGSVFYHLISGIRPNAQREDYIPLKVLLKGITIPTGFLAEVCSEELINIVDHCMEKNPRRRFQSADDLLDAFNHWEKWTNQARKRKVYRAVGGTVVVCVLAVTLCTGYVYHEIGRKQEFTEKYEEYLEAADQWMISPDDDNAFLIQKNAISLLNHKEYQMYLERDIEKKVNLLYGAACTSLAVEDYEDAVIYLEEIVRYDSDYWVYYRDLAVARFHLNQWTLSESAVETARNLGMDDNQKQYVDAEIAYAREDYENAYLYAVEGVKSTDSIVAVRCVNMAVHSAREMKNYRACIDVVNQYMDSQSIMEKDRVSREFWIRVKGNLCLEAVQSGEKDYLNDAISCYEELCQEENSGLDDQFCLESAYEYAGRYKEAETLLKDMLSEYGEQYKVYMKLAFLCVKQENEKKKEQRDYHTLEYYYKKLEELSEKNQGDEELEMVQLKQIIHELKMQGWIS